MAPVPTEAIDFPSLSDQFLDFLLAVWTFVYDLCITVWDYVSEAFWVVWTYPPFETFRNVLAAVLIVLIVFMYYVITHLIAAAAIAILATVVIQMVLMALMALRPCFLLCLGFGQQGVLPGSYAANYQSTSYSGNVPRGSTFSQFQSQGATGYRR